MRLMTAVLALSISASAFAKPPKYEVFAIQFATLPQFPVSSLVKGADPERKLDIAMMVWLIRGGGHNILVDSGFYREELVREWKPVDFVKPDEAVLRAGVAATDITDVIITHAHWDHAGGASLFPNAQIWIQKDEYEYYLTRTGRGGVTAEDMDYLRRANEAKRLHLVNGDNREILPGIRVYTGGLHTYASQYVSVTATPGTVVLASDNVYLYENIDQHVAIAQTFDAGLNLAAQDRMKSMVHDVRLIIPGHDPAVMQRFPRVTPGVVRIE